jgi:choline kinase
VRSVSFVPVRDALVLAAGNGDRFQNSAGQSKLLQPVLGQPLILRTIHTAAQAGLTTFEIVLGYQADAVRDLIERHLPAGTAAHFTYNPDWHLENGVSALAARQRLHDRRFALLMGDHLFDAAVLSRLSRLEMGVDESILAIDTRPVAPEIAAEATKVQLDGQRIIAIGKMLETYDALDTGLFICAPSLFAALDGATAAGDTTLSGGIRRLAAERLMLGAEVGDAVWYDIDTVDDLTAAEGHLAALPESA